MHQAQQFQQGLRQIEERIQELEAVADPNVRARTMDLVQLVMNMHGAGLRQMLEIISNTGAAGADIIDRMARDEMTAGLLLLYDLHPVDLQTRVKRALDKVRPYLKSHGGNVELLGIEDGFVRLQLEGSCHGCPSSAMTLKLAIEEALYEMAPDLTGLEVAGVVQPPPASGYVPLEIVQLGENGKGAKTW